MNASEVNNMKDYLCQFYDANIVDELAQTNECGLVRLYADVVAEKVKIRDLIGHPGPVLVNSPDGFVPVKSLVKKYNKEILEVTFKNGTSVKTSPFHMFETPTGQFISTVNLRPGLSILCSDGATEVDRVVDLGYSEDVYDLAVDHENHRYYTDGISSHNSGAGKSLFLQNISVNWAQAGLNVAYITLELSENLCAMRLDAMVAGIESREILKNIDNVSIMVKDFQKRHRGSIRLKQLPNGCTVNDIRSFVKESEVQTGKKIDAIVIDYLDLMMPVSVKVSPSDQFIKDKYISEELRNLATELQVLLVTASQLNRSSYDEVEFNPSNISGGISKVNTADNVIGIFTSMSMRESGRYQVQFMKTRSSSGVGQKVDLAFCPRTLRISDLDEGEMDSATATATSLMNSLRKKSAVTDPAKPETIENTAAQTKVQTTNLRDMLKRLDNR